MVRTKIGREVGAEEKPPMPLRVNGWIFHSGKPGLDPAGLGPSKNTHTSGLCNPTPGHVFQRNSHIGLKGTCAMVYALDCILW